MTMISTMIVLVHSRRWHRIQKISFVTGKERPNKIPWLVTTSGVSTSRNEVIITDEYRDTARGRYRSRRKKDLYTGRVGMAVTKLTKQK